MDSDSDRGNIAHLILRRKRSHAHLGDCLPVQSPLQAQIFPPAALKMRMMLVMWQVNSHNPVSGDCPVTPEGV
jgi:hypothetical protein